MAQNDTDTIICEIIQQFPEKEWMSRIHGALPGVDDGSILSAIEIFFGGDVRVVEDDGTEHGLFVPATLLREKEGIAF